MARGDSQPLGRPCSPWPEARDPRQASHGRCLHQHRSRLLTCSFAPHVFSPIFLLKVFSILPTRLLQHRSGSCHVKKPQVPCPRTSFYSNKRKKPKDLLPETVIHNPDMAEPRLVVGVRSGARSALLCPED